MLRLEPLFILFFSFSFHSRDTLHYWLFHVDAISTTWPVLSAHVESQTHWTSLGHIHRVTSPLKLSFPSMSKHILFSIPIPQDPSHLSKKHPLSSHQINCPSSWPSSLHITQESTLLLALAYFYFDQSFKSLWSLMYSQVYICPCFPPLEFILLDFNHLSCTSIKNTFESILHFALVAQT